MSNVRSTVLRVLVAPDVGADVDEGIAQRADRIGHRRHGLLDLVGVVPVALAHRQVALQGIGIEPLEARRDLDLAELVALALVDREGDEEAVAVGRQLGHRRDDAEVGVAFGQVELAQQLAVEIQAVGIEAVVRRQEAPPGALGGLDLAAQGAVAEMLVADEADPLDAGDVALVDLEHQIDAALLEPDDLRLDHGVVAAAAAIDREDALDVGLHARAGEDLAGLGLHFVAQLVVVDLLVALEGDAIDDRVLRHLHDQGRALHVDHDVGEQAGREQRLERAVGRRGIVGLAFLELQVGADRLRLGADVALDLNGRDRAAQAPRRRRAARRPARQKPESRQRPIRPNENSNSPPAPSRPAVGHV